VCQVTTASIEDALRELNEKYPSCSTCQFRGQRVHSVGKKKIPRPTTWCEKHSRPVEYNWVEYADDRGRQQRMVIGDVPCEEYAYQYRSASLFSHNGRNADRVVENS
jgi:hypothetical protein